MEKTRHLKQRDTHTVVANPQRVQRALLVAVEYPESSADDCQEMLSELEQLTDTLGIPTVDRMRVRIAKPSPRHLIGSGKAAQVVERARQQQADVIIFDDPLTPSQQRNWETLADLAVIDREEVILDIFGQRAHTKEAELQIALARAEYDLPRLKRRWTHLSRQRGMRGGAGLRGEGEQQIEIDYRLVQREVAQLKRRLAEVRKKRQVQRKKRMKKPVPNAVIVGYTNAGKSSLLNALTGAHVFTENKLFATLDPTTRRIVLPNQQELLLSDTVGFIRKLPHSLIEAFKATLEEVVLADFIVEVIDVTSHRIDDHLQTTRDVLEELGVADKRRLTVFNKVDLVEDALELRRLARRFPDAVFISARSGDGIAELTARLAAELELELSPVRLLIPHNRYELVALLHRTANIKQEKNSMEGVRIEASVPPATLAAVKEFAF
jgi:GTP-binding protein HflX